ncbi:MAG: YdeI/OmpD-associated family protein [Gillisia sp.]
MHAEIGKFLKANQKWQDEIGILRNIILGCHLTEEIKWGKPCYSYQGKNIVILQGFKEFCALMFFKGVLLKDTEGLLKKPGENSRISRRMEFTNSSEIKKVEKSVRNYIFEAIDAEKAGIPINLEKNPEPTPEELQQKLEVSPELDSAFNNLTPGRQRAYKLYFSAPKQSKTRTLRIEKYIPKILQGKGINDR